LVLVVAEETEELLVLLSDFFVELFADLSVAELVVDLSLDVEPEPLEDLLL